MYDPDVASARARVAVLCRHHPESGERIADARRDLAAKKLAAYISRVVAEAPPLTPEQRTRLAALLSPASAA
jgi:hypothetical protein